MQLCLTLVFLPYLGLREETIKGYYLDTNFHIITICKTASWFGDKLYVFIKHSLLTIAKTITIKEKKSSKIYI